jgi:hypothetical protein
MIFFNFFKSRKSLTLERKNLSSTFKTVQNNINSKPKFEYIPSSTITDILNFIKENYIQLGIELNIGASDEEIEDFEKNKIGLPEDFKLLYKFSNGFETDEDLFRLIPLSEIISNQKDDYLISDNSFHFTEYMIYCDMWTIDINSNNKNEYRIYNKTDNIVFLTNSISEYLSVFINKGIYDGLYEWREEIKKRT